VARTRTTLWSIVPSAKDLLRLDSPQLAHALMSCLRSYDEGESNLYNLGLAKEFTRGYPPEFQGAIDKALSGAWSWLLGQGYIGQKPGSSDSSWVAITPQGERWHDNNLSDLVPSGSAETSNEQQTPSSSFGLESLGLTRYRGLRPDEGLLLFLGVLLAIDDNAERHLNFTFTSMLATFLFSKDDLSSWFRQYIDNVQVFRDEIVNQSKLDPSRISLYQEGQYTTTAIGDLLAAKPLLKWSQSAERLMEEASTIAIKTSGNDSPQVGVRHLMAAYIYMPSGHDEQLKKWGVDKEDWGSEFIRWLATNFRLELDSWITFHTETFHKRPQIDIPLNVSEQAPPVDPPENTSGGLSGNAGPSTHVARDKWTIDDALGYFPYAYAIFRFLTDADTAPPLAVSIQAPWGGGKTSLMKMIQNQLDPSYPEPTRIDSYVPHEQQKKATVDQIRSELDSPLQSKSLPDSPIDGKGERLTVWFNAWKYESTNQIWAGMADAIVKQVGERLGPVERELFFFRLHMRRIDISRIRSRITNDLISSFVSNIYRWLWIYGIAPILLFALDWLDVLKTESLWKASTIANLLIALCQFFLTKRQSDKKPAELAMSDLVKAPDYDSNLGFVHQVSEDLKETLKLVPEKRRPIVIFIDDLDRCSPNKVSDVVEAIICSWLASFLIACLSLESTMRLLLRRLIRRTVKSSLGCRRMLAPLRSVGDLWTSLSNCPLSCHHQILTRWPVMLNLC
jgi:KAP family P-loop domain